MKDAGSLELRIRAGEQMHRQEQTCGKSGDSETENKTTKNIIYYRQKLTPIVRNRIPRNNVHSF